MRLWHDDVRPAPPGWVWARTNEEAKHHLLTDKVKEASLDHDMGYNGPPPGPCEVCNGTGKFWSQPYGSPGESYAPCAACDGDGFIGGDVLYIAGTSEETGLRLVEWMIETGNVPPRITIHSWNPFGAEQMAKKLSEVCPVVIVEPYRIKREEIKREVWCR